MALLQIQFSTSPAFSSGLIRRLSHSEFSHVDFIVPEGLLGVSGKDNALLDPGGVVVRAHEAWPYLGKPKIATIKCSDTVAKAAIDACRSQVGKPFDNSALWGFLNDQAKEPLRDWRDPESWFCSELIAWSLEKAGLFSYPLAVAKNRVTPADVLLIINPFMSADNISEFIAPLV